MICHHYKCVFVHIPKNAGQSVEHVFLERLGLTWEARAPLLLRKNDRPELGPPRLAHLTADEYVRCKYMPRWMFDDYFKFSFVRNPWSRMISFYKYLGYDRKCDFMTFLKGPFRNRLFREMYWFVRPQSDFLYSREGELLVDFVGRFETLQTDFDKVCREVNLPEQELPRINVTSARNADNRKGVARILDGLNSLVPKKRIPVHNRYQDYYDQESIDLVSDWYQRDIERFNYTF